MNPFKMRPERTGDLFVDWEKFWVKPYNKNEVNPYTRTRIILMNGTEFENVWFSHQFSRSVGDDELRRKLAYIRKSEQQQQKILTHLKPADESALEHTIGYEQLAVDLTAHLAKRVNDKNIKSALDFALLEDFDHLYRYADYLDFTTGEHAEKLGCPYYELKREDTEIHKITKDGIRFSLKDKTYGDTVFDIPCIARYQVMNAALAVKTIQVLEDQIPVSLEALKAGMAKTRWQGRMETVLPGVIVDGAHNEDGVEKFVETAEHFQKEYPLTLLFSAVDDKDYTDMIRTILDKLQFRHVVVTQVGGYRKVPAVFRKPRRKRDVHAFNRP